ncbi:hypothetical protein Tco_1246198 [Tanacetum coccineum]
MDPNTRIGQLCLGENNQGYVAEGIKNKEQWEAPEFQDTASSGQEKEAKVFTFYRMEEEGEHYFTPFYVGELHAYDGEIKLKYEQNLISNEFVVKLCLEYEERIGEKLVKRELLVSLKGEFYFVKFIVNPEEDDVEPNVVLEIDEAGLLPFICKMGKRKRNKKRALENFLFYYSDVGPSLSNGKPLTQEEATREALAIDICKRFSILKEERPVIKSMAYSDKYKKILDGIVMDKIKLDGEIKKEEVEAIKQVKGEALQEKEDPGAFIILIRLEAKIDLDALADTEPMGVLKGVLCQVGVTTIIAKFLILDMPIDRDAPILVGRGFLYTCGSILNARDRITSTFDGVCHQTFHAANNEESNSDDEEDYGI